MKYWRKLPKCFPLWPDASCQFLRLFAFPHYASSGAGCDGCFLYACLYGFLFHHILRRSPYGSCLCGGILLRGHHSTALFPGAGPAGPGTAALCLHAERAFKDLQRRPFRNSYEARHFPPDVLALCPGSPWQVSRCAGHEKDNHTGRMTRKGML